MVAALSRLKWRHIHFEFVQQRTSNFNGILLEYGVATQVVLV